MQPANTKKITQISAVDQVYESLKQNILSGVWKGGEKLPSEGALAEEYGVNRLTVRMALQSLNTLGVVVTKTGEGTYVREFSLPRLLSQVSDFFIAQKSFDEIYALRILIEVECCRLAILHAAPEDYQQLGQQLERYLEAKEAFLADYNQQNFNIMVEEDLLFHYQICQMSGSSVYVDVFFLTRSIIRQYLTEMISYRGNRILQEQGKDEVDEHILIYNEICAGNFEACREAYIQLLTMNKTSAPQAEEH